MKKKRLIFCTNSSLYSTLVLEAILSSSIYKNGDIQVVGVFLSTKIRTQKGSFFGDVTRIIKISGVRYALYLALYSLFFELCRFKNFRPTVSQLCQQHQIEIYKSKDINTSGSQTWLKNKIPDVILSSFFNQKFSKDSLAIPSIAAVNLHPALLPKYKGVDPVFYYLLNEENTLGVTLHLMDETYDTGAILKSSTMEKQETKSISWHNLELFKLGAGLFIEWLKEENGVSKEVKNKSLENEQYDSWPSSKEVCRLKTPLFKISDFLEQARYIEKVD